MRVIISLSLFSVISLCAAMASAESLVMLSEPWGQAACEAWNADSVLSEGLFESGWVTNHKNNRGFRLIEIYRSDCPKSPHIQLKLVPQGSRAQCEASGPLFDADWDFLMYAKTADWVAMGKGEVGPMGGMMTGKLKFDGSMWEAMQNMGPFKNFLLLFGKVPTSVDACN